MNTFLLFKKQPVFVHWTEEVDVYFFNKDRIALDMNFIVSVIPGGSGRVDF